MANPYIEFGNLVLDVVSSHGTDADQRKRESRVKLYRQLPNENFLETPFTKMVMSKSNDSVQNPKFEFGMEAHDDLYVQATGAYNDDDLAVGHLIADGASTAEGAEVYIKMSAANAKQIVINEEIQLRVLHKTDIYDDHHECALHGVVTDIHINGDSSYLTVSTLHDDDDEVLGMIASANYDNYVMPLSPAMPEGSKLPFSRYREPTEHFNYTQIFMAGLGLTGTELSNAQRFSESTYNRYWRQVMKRFDKYVERAIMWGTRRLSDATVNMGNGNQVVDQYRTGGLYWMLRNLSDNASNYINIAKTTTYMGFDFSGKTWDEGCHDFIKLYLLDKSKKSGSRKQLYCSALAKQSIMTAFENSAQVNISPYFKNKWGFEVTRIDGLNCTLELFQHQDLSCVPGWESIAFLVEPEKLAMRTKKGRDMTVIRSIKDLKKKANVESGETWRDATQEGIFMDAGFLADDLDGMGVIVGLGKAFGEAQA